MSTSSKNCGHAERPIVKNCLNCGRSLCYQCHYSEALSTKVTGKSSFAASGSGGSMYGGGISSQTEFGTFCANCYLDIVNEPEYRLLGDRNDFGSQITYKPEKASFFNPFSYTTPVVSILSIILIPVVGLGFPVMGILYSKQNGVDKEYLAKENKSRKPDW